MNQSNIWEKEYKNPQLVTGRNEPQNDFKRFIKWFKKDRKVSLEDLRVLDLGSGFGKNAIFLAERGAKVIGLEISKIAIEEAERRAKDVGVLPPQLRGDLSASESRRSNLSEEKIASSDALLAIADGSIEFLHHDIGTPYPFKDGSFDLVLDVISSNSLNEKGREVYLTEVHRVLKKGGYFFVRALCKDGDKNAENLLKTNPGKEKDTYVMPEIKLTERVFSKEDFETTYKKNFQILKLQRKSGYAQVKGKVYKRNYWIAYLQK